MEDTKLTHNPDGTPMTGKDLHPWYNRKPLKSSKDPMGDRVFRKLADKFGYAEVKADMRSMTHAEFAESYGIRVKS